MTCLRNYSPSLLSRRKKQGMSNSFRSAYLRKNISMKMGNFTWPSEWEMRVCRRTCHPIEPPQAKHTHQKCSSSLPEIVIREVSGPFRSTNRRMRSINGKKKVFGRSSPSIHRVKKHSCEAKTNFIWGIKSGTGPGRMRNIRASIILSKISKGNIIIFK